jgi:hypothetical protein
MAIVFIIFVENWVFYIGLVFSILYLEKSENTLEVKIGTIIFVLCEVLDWNGSNGKIWPDHFPMMRDSSANLDTARPNEISNKSFILPVLVA